MLRVTVELFPHGNVRNGRILSQSFIVNDGTGNESLGNYVIGDGYNQSTIENYKRNKGHRLLVAKTLQLLDEELNK